MPRTDRTYNKGRLVELLEKRKAIQIQIDVIVKGLIYHFDPMDNDLEYVFTIDPMRLKINVRDIDEKVKELKKLQADVDKLKAELGTDGE